jgi:hypothetical protein
MDKNNTPITFDDLMFMLLNPDINWKIDKNKIYLNKDNIYYEINFYGKYEDISIKISDQELFILSDLERKILAKAITFLRGNMPRSISEAVENKTISFKEFSISQYYPPGGRSKIPVLIYKIKQPKYTFISNHIDIFDSEPLGTISDLFNNIIDSSVNYSSELEREDKPLFKLKRLQSKFITEKEDFESLVLWDIENVHFYDDVQIISRMYKAEKQLKVVSFFQKHKSSDIKIKMDMEFKLNKLRKRNWVVKRTKGIADNVLIETFHKYKDQLKELILISADSDFKEIIDEAIQLGIKIVVVNNANYHTNIWYNSYNYTKIGE